MFAHLGGHRCGYAFASGTLTFIGTASHPLPDASANEPAENGKYTCSVLLNSTGA